MTLHRCTKLAPLSTSLARFASVSAIAAAMAMAATASAASYSWDPDADPLDGPDGGTGTWNTANLFWYNGTSDLAWPNTSPNADTAIFGGTAGTVTLGAPINANGLQFDITGYTIDNGGTAANSLTFSGTNPFASVAASSSATISAVVAGSAWTKTGAGTLTLSGTNTFSGVTVSAGTLAVGALGNLGAGGITLNGGTLNTTGAITVTAAANAITIGANGGTIDNTSATKFYLNAASLLTGSGTLTRNASANNTLANVVQFGGANTGFTGAVVLNGGVTEVNTNGLGTGTTAGNSITVNSGAELVASNFNLANALILNGGVVGGDQGTSTLSGAITVNGATSVRLGDFFQNTNRNLNITGNLSGSGALTTINNGNTATNATGQVLTLNPTTGNNAAYAGTLTASAGNNVVFSSANALLTGGAVSIASNATQVGGIGVGYDFGAAVPSFTNALTGTTAKGVFGINTTLAPTTTINLSTLGGGGMILGSQTAGTYTATTLGADATVYRLGGGTGTLTLPNATLTGANSLSVGDARVNGNSTVVLSGANTFTGATTVNSGTLIVSSLNSVTGGATASSLGAPTTATDGTINLGNGTSTGTLRYAGPGETSDRVINLAGTTGGGTVENFGPGLLKLTSAVTYTGAGAKSLTLGGPGSGEISGDVVGGVFGSTSPLTISKTGGGTWTLSGTGNTATTLTISGGVLNTGANGITINNSGGSSVAASGNGTISGKIILGGTAAVGNGGDFGASAGNTLTLSAAIVDGTTNTLDFYNGSAGTTVLTGANTYTGVTNINQQIVSVGTINSVVGGTASSNLGAPTSATNGTIWLGASGASTLRYTGAGETTDRIIDLRGTTASGTIEQAGTGLLKFTSNFAANGAGIKVLGLSGSTTGTGEIAGAIVNNSATNTTGVTKTGTGTWTLSGANTYTGPTAVNGGTLTLNGETGSLATTPLTLNTGGNFNYLGKSSGSTQTFGALTATAGQGTLTSTYGGAGNTSVTLASYARTAGATANFVTSGGANGTTNKITITGQAAAGFINQGTFFNGADFAYNDGTGATGYLRAPVYGTDANFVNAPAAATLGTTTTASHVQVQGNISTQTTASVATLKFDAARTLAITTGNTLTAGSGGIIAVGGTTTISGGTLTSGTAEMSVRTPGATDGLTISSVLAGSGGLTKSGSGTLFLNQLTNTFTGNIFVNGGTLSYVGTNSSADPVSLGAGAKTITLTNGAILNPTVTSNPTSGTKSFVVGAGGATFNVANGVTLQLDDASQFSGTGDLTVTGAGSGAVFLNNQAFTYSGNVFVNSGTLRLGANSGVLGSGSGRNITVGSGGVLDLQTGTIPLGLILNGTGISSGGALINSSTTAAGTLGGPVTINSGATIGGAGSITLSGPVGGAGLTKVGAGNLTLSNTNNFGATTINAGTVTFGTPTSFGAAGASVTVAAGAAAAAGYVLDQDFLSRITTGSAGAVAITANNANNLNFSSAGANLTAASLGATGAFTYTGTLTPNGTTYRLGGGGGTLTLANTNAITGANNLVTAGNVILAASNDYTGTTAVNSGTLTLTTTSTSSGFTVASGATLQVGTGGTAGSVGSATLTGGGVNSTLAYNRSDNVTTGAFTGTFGITQANGTSTLTVNSASTSIARLNISASGGTIDLGATNRNVGVDGGNSLQMLATGTGTINGIGVITLAADASDIGAVAGGTLVVNPVIAGTNGLDIYNGGAGTVVFNAANTYSGVTNIQSGTLSVGTINSVTGGTASSNLGAPTTAAAGTINLGNGTSTTVAALKYTGTGETTDRVVNLVGTTNGGTIDQSGTGLLKFTSAFTASGAGSKTLTLQGSTAGTGEIAGAIVDNTGTNKTSLTKAGTGTWTLSGTSTYTGGTVVSGGTLNLSGTLGATAIAVNAGGIFNETTAGVIGGAASFTNSGGTSTLSGTNTFTGGVTVSGGPLTITSSGALGTGTKTVTIIPTTNPTSNPSLRLDGSAGPITLPSTFSFNTSFDTVGASGAVLDGAAVINVAGSNTIAGNFSIPTGGGGLTLRSNGGTLNISGNITPSATGRSLRLRGDGNGVVSGTIADGTTVGLPVFKDQGTGTWTLSGTNTYTGPTTVTAGTLQFAKQVSLYNNVAASRTAANLITGSGATLAFNVGGAGEFTATDIDTIKALGTASNGFANGSNLGLDTTNASGGNFTYGTAVANTNGGANAIGLTKLGTNTLTLSAGNTYTGATNVKAGTLAVAVSGSISGSTAVNVFSGATLDTSAFNATTGFNVPATQTLTDNGTVSGNLNVSGVLGGNGNVNGSVTALSGSTVAPGNSPGTLTISSDFALNTGSHLAMELGTVAPGTSDRLTLTGGTLTLGGSLDVSLLQTFASNVGDVFTLILNGGGNAVGGTFSNVTPLGGTTGSLVLGTGQTFTINYAANLDSGAIGNDVTATLAAVPEPSAGAALIGGLSLLLGLARRRRAQVRA